jgi:hypothetical protein
MTIHPTRSLSFPIPLAMALFALSGPIWAVSRIFLVVDMPTNTSCLLRSSGSETISSHGVFHMGDGLQMEWINAMPNSTDVI